MPRPSNPESSNGLHPTVGRGAVSNPVNRFEAIHIEDDFEHLCDSDDLPRRPKLQTTYLNDQSETIVSENKSPDLGFRYSLNPYRGCSHGCSYCYARPSHEYLGFNTGLDFESKIMVKQNAASLLKRWLARKSWQPEPIMLSGVTDPYQTAERKFGITRECLQVAWETRQPVQLITKNSLICRDIDLLTKLAAKGLVNVTLSITSLDQNLIKLMEPRTSSPKARFTAIGQLAAAGIPVNINTAPIIPGLNDSEIPALLEMAKEHGATSASYILLRLPYSVKEVFLDWVDERFSEKRSVIESRIRATSNDRLNRIEFGNRMSGEGIYADQIRQTFSLFKARFGLEQELPVLRRDLFRRPNLDGQLELF